MREGTYFNFTGYHLEKINLVRDINSVPDKLFLKVVNITSLNEEKTISMWIEVKINFLEGNQGEFIYRSLFNVDNIEFNKENENFDENLLNEDQKELALKMIMTVFPFIRQSLDSITNDYSFNIKLPIIDSRDILSGVTLNYVSSSENDSKPEEEA